MADWSIKIVPVTGPPSGPQAAFVPQLQPVVPTGLNVSLGDVVTWNNTTSQDCQPWPADSGYRKLSDAQVGPRGSANYLSDLIPAGKSSRPSWIAVASPVTQKTIYYVCKLHPEVRGVITIA